MRETNTSLLGLPSRYTVPWSAHNDVEVHTEDTDTGVVTSTQVDVLLDTETEVTSIREVLAPELVLLHLQTTLQDLLSLGATNGNMDSDLFVTTDAECSDGVTGF